MTDNEDLFKTFNDEIAMAINSHGDEIQSIADLIYAETDETEADLSEILDDIANEIKGQLGTQAANNTNDDNAGNNIFIAEVWVANNICNSTNVRRVAAAYAFLGSEEARQRLGKTE